MGNGIPRIPKYVEEPEEPWTILRALNDPNLFQPFLKDPETWKSWLVFLRALFALPMDAAQLETYKTCTGRTNPPTVPATEAWLVIGRRGGKSFTLALIAVYLATFNDFRKFLQPGEKATVMVLACDRKQARTILRYIQGLLSSIPMLARMVVRQTQDEFELDNRVQIEIHTSSFRAVRGYTICAALVDELAFFYTDENSSANPDQEVINAIRPAMSTIPGAMLLCASSPYARRGTLYDAWRRHYGKDGDNILVWQAPTRTMNPSVPQSFIDAAYEADPESAKAEYGAQFRSDIEAFVTREAVESCIDSGVRERAPLRDVTYQAFCDPAGGSGGDIFTLAVGHRNPDATVEIDAIRERKPPFSPDECIAEFAAVLKSYSIVNVFGDRFAGEFPRELFRFKGITYEVSEFPKTSIYRDFLPLVNSRKISLLDHPKLINQLVSLERKVARGGKDSIDHPPGPNFHDDVANSVAGVATRLAATGGYDAVRNFVGDEDDSKFWQRQQWRTFRAGLVG